MADDVNEALGPIRALAAKKTWDDALDLALAAWRKTRSPAFARLVEAVSSKISRAPIPTRESYYDAFHSRWISRTRSRFAVDVPVLLDGLGVDLTMPATREPFEGTRAAARIRDALAAENTSLEPLGAGPWAVLAIRLDALASMGNDPRVPRALVRFLKLAPIKVDGAPWVATYGPVYDLIAQTKDVRILPALEALPPSAARDRAVTQLRAVDVPKLAGEALVDELAKELGYTPPPRELDVSELLQLVVQDLDDDTPRVVLADHWLEVGDPRGEFVALQLRAERGELDDVGLDRMSSLQAQNESDWLGHLAHLTRERRFSRGFLDDITLVPDASASKDRWEDALLDSRLGTVRTLRRGGASEALYLRFVRAAVLANLREIEIDRPELLTKVTALPPPARIKQAVLTTQYVTEEVLHAEVVSLIELGFERVSLPFVESRAVGRHAGLLKLATPKCAIRMTAIDVVVVATVTSDGPALDIVSKDAVMVIDALRSCADASLALKRPRGASIWGPDGRTRDLAERVKRMGARASVDASWKAMFAR